MGLLQKAYETYETHQARAGIYYAAETEPLAPWGHILTGAGIEITLDQEGQFKSARLVEKKEPKILIPVTEESSGRTSGICPHPLCDQLGYISPKNEKKYQAYLEQLSMWVGSEFSHPKLEAILQYVKGGSILFDLERNGIQKYEDKSMICWRILGEEIPECWKDSSLFQAYQQFYQKIRSADEKNFCMVLGKNAIPAQQHLKGIVSINGNAKLISSNDSVNYTYRGRFSEVAEAAGISYEASQKAHNALKWLVANQGVMLDERAVICWNPQGYPLPKSHLPLRRTSKETSPKVPDPTDYQKDLNKIVYGYQAELPEQAGTVIAAFDAATTGRLALTYYNELAASDFLERLKYWDSTCCFVHRYFGCTAPSLDEIVHCTWGMEQNGKLELPKKIRAEQMQRLISCRVDKAFMPFDIMQALVQKASNPLAYDPKSNNWDEVVFTACAVIRKYHIDHFKEEYYMALETDKKDRSYQYGRLLAVMEKAERDTYQKGEGREPNAIRMLPVFSQRPAYAAKNILEQLKKAYMPRLTPGSRAFYEKLIGEIYEMLSEFPDSERNKPLTESYLPGYYLQKNTLYQSKQKEEEI